MRIKDLEFRKVRSIGHLPKEYYEIVKWQESEKYGESCYTLLSYKDTKDCIQIEFCSDRPFMEVENHFNITELWSLMEYGQNFLENERKLKKSTEDI